MPAPAPAVPERRPAPISPENPFAPPSSSGGRIIERHDRAGATIRRRWGFAFLHMGGGELLHRARSCLHLTKLGGPGRSMKSPRLLIEEEPGLWRVNSLVISE